MRFLAALGLISNLQGQALPGVGPRLPEVPVVESLPPVKASGDQSQDGGLVMARLDRIVLISPAAQGEVERAFGLWASDDLVLPSPRALGLRLRSFLGRPLTEGALRAIADEILIHYDYEGYPVVAIEALEEEVGGGILRLRLEVGRYGEVGVSRSRFGDPDVIRRGLRLRGGDLVRRGQLDEQLAWYGRTVFRRPRMFVAPGLEPATADLLIAFEESRPWRVNLGYENSGPDLLGRERWLLGVAGMTRSEQLLAWQGVVGIPASSLVANALRWEIPFHSSHHLLQLDAAYAEVLSRYASGGIPVESEGRSWSLAAYHRMPLPALEGWRQSWGAGLELKGTDQFLLFGGGSVAPGEVVLFHGKLGHELTRNWETGAASLQASVLAAPGGLGARNEDQDFKAYDPAADANYVAARLAGEGWWTPGGDWRIVTRGGLQVADSRLLPAEQFAAGGYQSVRGVGERDVAADGGWQASLELHSPQMAPVEGAEFRVLAFLDHAGLENRKGTAASVSGTGIGLRMRMADRFDVRFDHGWRLDEDESRSHFGIQISF